MCMDRVYSINAIVQGTYLDSKIFAPAVLVVVDSLPESMNDVILWPKVDVLYADSEELSEELSEHSSSGDGLAGLSWGICSQCDSRRGVDSVGGASAIML